MNFQLIIGSVILGAIITLGVLLDRCKDDKMKLELSIKTQNDAIEANRVDYEKKLNDYKNRKPRTVFVPVEVNVTRSDCDDVKNLLGAINSTSF